jgi:hypothetical protein
MLEAGRLAWIFRRCRVTDLKMVLLLWISPGSTRSRWFSHTGTFSGFPAKLLLRKTFLPTPYPYSSFVFALFVGEMRGIIHFFK